MNSNLDRVIKGYLYSYINKYNVYTELCKNENENLSYKEFKIKQVARYLNIPNNFFRPFRLFILLFSRLEVLVYVLMLILKFFSYSFMYFFMSKKNVQNRSIMLGLNIDNDRLLKILKSANVNIDNILIVKIPSINSNYNNFETVHLFSGINYNELFFSFWYAVKTSFFMKKKYGNKDFMFRSYSSFEYFLAYFYLKRSDFSNDYYFVSLLDRWAYLARYIKKTKYLIQHGILYESMKIKKIGSVDYACYINDEQRIICEKRLLTNKPHASYRSSIQLSSNHKLLNNRFTHVLLICNKFFFDKEDIIIRGLSNKKVNLYIKPHPVDRDISIYKNLLKEYDFVILDKNDYPKVDIVISYKSTLADEYQSKGVKILRYDDKDFNFKYKNII